MRNRAIICLFVAAAVVMVGAVAEAQTIQWESYAAKFVCGSQTRGPFEAAVDGKYKTSINIHNPNYLQDESGAPRPLQLFKKIVLAPHQAEPPVPPSCFIEELLDADFAVSVNCGNIVAQLRASNLPPTTPVSEGFVVILVPPFQDGTAAVPPVDVTAFYTARSRADQADIKTNGVSTWDVERVEATQFIGQPPISVCPD